MPGRLRSAAVLPLSEAPFDAAALKDNFVAAAWNGALDKQDR